MNNNHRHFIQLMLNNGMVQLNDALSFYEKISPKENSLAHLKSLITQINREITNQSYKIVFSTCEVTGEKVILWLNTKNDESSRQQVGFSPVELEYFHVLMQEIISSDDHRLIYPRCINITSTLTAILSRENGEKALNRWITGGYLVKKDEYIYLGPRTIHEFTTYLRTNTENCTCDLCADLIFVGATCASCNKIFHSICIEKYLQNQHTCPNCKSEWEPMEDSQNNMETDDEEAGPSKRRR